MGQVETGLGAAGAVAVGAAVGSSTASADDGVVPKVAGSMVSSWSPAVVSTGEM
jgi:hypothetical protein